MLKKCIFLALFIILCVQGFAFAAGDIGKCLYKCSRAFDGCADCLIGESNSTLKQAAFKTADAATALYEYNANNMFNDKTTEVCNSLKTKIPVMNGAINRLPDCQQKEDLKKIGNNIQNSINCQ